MSGATLSRVELARQSNISQLVQEPNAADEDARWVAGLPSESSSAYSAMIFAF